MNCTKFLNLKAFRRKNRGQVFILATLVIVVYTVSMIAVVTELSINRTQTDDIDLPHMVNEYLSEMEFQLQLQLFNYIGQIAYTQSDIVSGLQSFINIFTLYANNKGVGATITLRLNEFNFNAIKNTTVPNAINLPYSSSTFISINSSILFQSSNSDSKISGTFNHYYGVNMLVSATNNQVLRLTQQDANGNILQYFSGATFGSPSNIVDNNNGNYTYSGTLQGQAFNLTLATGLQLIS